MRIKGDSLSIYDVDDIAFGRTSVTLDSDSLERVHRAYERVQTWGVERHPVYGVNTGFGELAHVIVPPDKKTELQRNLLRSHAAGAGEPFSDEVVRAIMTVRLNCLMKGSSGVSIKTVQMLDKSIRFKSLGDQRAGSESLRSHRPISRPGAKNPQG